MINILYVQNQFDFCFRKDELTYFLKILKFIILITYDIIYKRCVTCINSTDGAPNYT